jgi:excisionase family DNA binding protein
MTQTDYTIKQAAAMLGCSPQTVMARIKAGRIGAWRLGGIGTYRIPADEVERARTEWVYKSDTRLGRICL